MSDTTQFVGADDLALNQELAVAYLAKRPHNLEEFLKGIQWEARDGYTISANLYGQTIVHELRPRSLHASPCWGELFWNQDTHAHAGDPVMFTTFENFAAYALAKWW